MDRKGRLAVIGVATGISGGSVIAKWRQRKK